MTPEEGAAVEALREAMRSSVEAFGAYLRACQTHGVDETRYEAEREKASARVWLAERNLRTVLMKGINHGRRNEQSDAAGGDKRGT